MDKIKAVKEAPDGAQKTGRQKRRISILFYAEKQKNRHIPCGMAVFQWRALRDSNS